MTFTGIEAHVRAEVEEGLFATGGQLYVSIEGDVVMDLAFGVDGRGLAVTSDTLFAIYCSGKPAVALALAGLLDDGEVSLDDHVGDVIDRALPAGLAPVEIRHLLNHTAGLHGYEPSLYLALPKTRRHQMLMAACSPAAGWEIGRRQAYAEVLAWYVLGLVIESLQPLDLRQFVQARVLDPLDVADDLFVGGMSADEYERHRHRLGVNAYLEGTKATPILTEANRRFRCLSDPALGTSGSARAIGRFYEGVLGEIAGAGRVARSVTVGELTSRQSYGHDHVLGRTCGFGYGFMVGMADHLFGQVCSQRSFGHSAHGGMTAAVADPDMSLVVAFHFNGRIDAESAFEYRRPALVNRIYRAVAAVA